MRINVYSQELTKEVKMVSSDTTGTDGEPVTYHGVRMYLASPDILHHTPDDDDRSAITFWVPQNNTFSPTDLAALFINMGEILARAYDVPIATVLAALNSRYGV